jgi:hypothetical protein
MRLVLGFVFAAVALLSIGGRAGASHVLDTGSGYQTGPLYVTVLGHNGDSSFLNSSGSIGQPPNFASIDGIALPYMYCVEIFTDIGVQGTYGVDLSTTGIVHGALVPNAGEIAWLIDNFAASATTQDQQEGLQAAIWQQVYGAAFSVDPVNTGAGIYANYQADILALGSNTAPVSDLLWISPYNGDGSPAQGQVTSFGTRVPEPSTIALLGLGACCFVGVRLRKRFAR